MKGKKRGRRRLGWEESEVIGGLRRNTNGSNNASVRDKREILRRLLIPLGRLRRRLKGFLRRLKWVAANFPPLIEGASS